MKNNFEIITRRECFRGAKIFDHIIIDGLGYPACCLTDDALALCKIMMTKRYKNNIDYFIRLAELTDYETIIQGLKDLRELGANIASDEMIRQLVIIHAKDKYKGLMR